MMEYLNKIIILKIENKNLKDFEENIIINLIYLKIKIDVYLYRDKIDLKIKNKDKDNINKDK